MVVVVFRKDFSLAITVIEFFDIDYFYLKLGNFSGLSLLSGCYVRRCVLGAAVCRLSDEGWREGLV